MGVKIFNMNQAFLIIKISKCFEVFKSFLFLNLPYRCVVKIQQVLSPTNQNP